MVLDDPFEYLSFGRTLTRSFKVYCERLDVFMALSAVVLIPYAILTRTLNIFLTSVYTRQEEIPDFHPKHIPMVVFILTLQLALYTFVTIIGRAAIIKAISIMYIGQRPTSMSCLRSAWNKKRLLVGANMLIYCAVIVGILIPSAFIWTAFITPNVVTIIIACIGALLLVFGGLYVYVGVVLTNPTLVVEGITQPIPAIHRSWELCTGSRCYIFCSLFLLFVMNYLFRTLLHAIFPSGDSVIGVLSSIFGMLIQFVPMLIFFPLYAILETVIYLNLRVGRESMNHQVLSGDMMTDSETNSQSRFRNDDPTAATGSYMAASLTGPDYRHVPLMDTLDETVTFEPSTSVATQQQESTPRTEFV